MYGVTSGVASMAQDDFEPFLGADFWPWMVLAFGAAMVVGNLLALLRPPGGGGPGHADARTEPSRLRAGVLIAIGLAAAAWGLASLLA